MRFASSNFSASQVSGLIAPNKTPSDIFLQIRFENCHPGGSPIGSIRSYDELAVKLVITLAKPPKCELRI
jgi:hypothetical protein